MSSSTASGSPPKPARMSFDISLLSSHHAPVHAKPQASAAAPAALRTRMQSPSPHPAESLRGLASAFSVTSGSQGKLSVAEHMLKPEHVRSPFQGLSMGLRSVSEALPMVTSQSQLTTSPTAPFAESFHTVTYSSDCPILPWLDSWLVCSLSHMYIHLLARSLTHSLARIHLPFTLQPTKLQWLVDTLKLIRL